MFADGQHFEMFIASTPCLYPENTLKHTRQNDIKWQRKAYTKKKRVAPSTIGVDMGAHNLHTEKEWSLWKETTGDQYEHTTTIYTTNVRRKTQCTSMFKDGSVYLYTTGVMNAALKGNIT